jgi:hypothetical protein
MTTINLKRALLKRPTRLMALAAVGTLLTSFTGSALVERIEKHAAEDRLSFGTIADAPPGTIWLTAEGNRLELVKRKR